MGVGSSRLGLGLALAVLAGCGSQSGALPSGAKQAPSRAQEASGSSGDLLYVAPKGFENPVAFYSYPAVQLIGHIDGAGTGLCSDNSGNVYVTDGYVNEFAHGGTESIKTLGNASQIFKGGCTVDSLTGNLAAVESAEGTVGIFRKADGAATIYSTPGMYATFCGYDDAGNLFVDGRTMARPEKFRVAELRKGTHTFSVLSLNVKPRKPGQVQWDGTHITVVDARGRVVYRLRISGVKATVIGVTPLNDTGTGVQQTWIYENTIVVPFRLPPQQNGDTFGFWNYPSGGAPIQTFKGPSDSGQINNAVTISVAPPRESP